MIREALRKKIDRSETCKIEHETENEKQQGVNVEKICQGQPSFVIPCIMVENSIEQEHDKKNTCWLF